MLRNYSQKLFEKVFFNYSFSFKEGKRIWILKVILTLQLLFHFQPLFSQKQEETFKKIRQAVKNLSEDATLSGGMVGYSLRDISGKEIINFNSDKALIPASNLKVLTTATALKILGENYRFKTDLLYTGEIKDGVLKGDLILFGSGDPTLGGGRIPGNPSYDELLKILAGKVKEIGIKKIEGKVIQDFSCTDKNILPGGWIWEDIGNYYGAGVSGLNFNENLYKITFRPGRNSGDSAQIISIDPEIPGLYIENKVLTGAPGSGDNAWIFGSPYTNYRYISGTIPAGVNEFTIKGSIPDPPFLAVYLLHKALKKEGIFVKENPSPSGDNICLVNSSAKLIYSHFSPTIKEIIEPANKNSINLYAEALYKAAGKKISEGQDERSFILEYWKKRNINVSGNFILDGSGLSPRNAVKASFISEVLHFMSKDSLSFSFISSLPVSSESGTLAKFCKGTAAEKRVIAKSGSMARVIGYSGYFKSKNGKLYSFCILVNNYEGKTAEMVKKIEKIMEAMAEL
jgi:D-alanyl-D-alanine carboxypeptidase/D-alanyl-D-alanine-endopeptidase (penicillin-binding protein 4)